MSFIDWKDDETTFVSEVDSQHKQIIILINELHKLLPSDDKKQKAEKLYELLSFLDHHFTTEENLMKEHKFQNSFSHTQEHNKMRNKMIKYKNDFNSDKVDLNLEFLLNIKSWFHNHNLINDIKMGKFLNSVGIK